MPRNIDNDDDTETVVDISDEQKPGTAAETPPEDNGNTPETPAEAAAREAERVKALRKVAAASDPDDDEDGAPGAMIPRTRFKEVNTRMQKAEAEAAALRELIASGAVKQATAAPAAAPAPAEPEFNLKAKIREKNAALASGDDALADKLDEEILEHSTKKATAAALKQFQEETAQQTQADQQKAMARVAADVKVAYPLLDEKNAKADMDAIDLVVVKRDRLIADGVPAHKALAQAVENVAKVFGWAEPGKGAATAAATGDPAVDKRIEEARRRNAEAANRQPPVLSGTGERATATARVNVAEMTDEQFAALPEAEKKRLRGDM